MRSLQFAGIIIPKSYIKEDPMKKILSTLLAVIVVVLASLFGFTGGEEAPALSQQIEILPEETSAVPSAVPETEAQPQAPPETVLAIVVGESYTSKEDVALYIHTYGCLPDNFITKNEPRKLGWEGGSLEPYAPGKCIGGDRFGNYEGLLPEDRDYKECDIDTLGAKSRGAKRIVFSEDGLIYYTEDHYESFELLYGEP